MKRKRKKRIRFKTSGIIILSVLLILCILLIINYKAIKIKFLSYQTKYDEKTISTLLEDDLVNKIKSQKYSQTLDEIINTEYFDSKYIDEYLNISYYNQEDFLKNTEGLLKEGYNSEEINLINKSLSTNSIEILLESDYLKDLTEILKLAYFKEDNLKRYIKYLDNKDLSIEEIITHVNIGLDNKYYTNVIKLDNQDSIDVIVNKYHVLSGDYVPSKLENVKYGSGQMRHDAKVAFDKMCDAARKDNIYISGGSGYRSYSYQKNLYNNYVARDGFQEAETYSARPGYSEHQTGLAMDIINGSGSFISSKDKEYTWLVNNSYKYGFILRYPKGKEKITGYMYEEWHYRFLGEELAKKVYESNLTYDEYVARNY